MNVSNVSPEAPYKETQFEGFLALIGLSGIKYWKQIAETLGVSRKTIERWRQHPLAVQAIIMEVSKSIEQMDRAGKNDWRMYREKLAMLGLARKSKYEIEPKSEELGDLINSMDREFEAKSNKSVLSTLGH